MFNSLVESLQFALLVTFDLGLGGTQFASLAWVPREVDIDPSKESRKVPDSLGVHCRKGLTGCGPSTLCSDEMADLAISVRFGQQSVKE